MKKSDEVLELVIAIGLTLGFVWWFYDNINTTKSSDLGIIQISAILTGLFVTIRSIIRLRAK